MFNLVPDVIPSQDSPEFKGIKTRGIKAMRMRRVTLKTALNSKGLRPGLRARRTTMSALKTALNSKGLRLVQKVE